MKAKNCKNCGRCKYLYIESNDHFYRRNILYCTARGEIIVKAEVCGDWIVKKGEYDLTEKRFDIVEEDIKFILEYLKGCNPADECFICK